MTMVAADLELSLRRQSPGTYTVAGRYVQPDSDADTSLGPAGSFTAQFDFAQLLTLASDPIAYGRALGKQLFADTTLQTAFAQARANARTLASPLRMRLFIEPGAAELHALRWETLRDPADDVCLATGERILFSRYLSSGDWGRVPRRAQADLRALVVIANPSDLDTFQLAPLDVPSELERATASLGAIPVTALASGGKATLDRLVAALRDGCDILYLVCHGALRAAPPRRGADDNEPQGDRTSPPGRGAVYTNGVPAGGRSAEGPAGATLPSAPSVASGSVAGELASARQASSLPQRGADGNEPSASVAQLWLEDETGKTHRVDGATLVESIKGLAEPPRLVVLASCQSAQMTGVDNPLAALGPQLAESGVAAVVAMQGNISLPTVAQFMPLFFAELQRDGQIDRAMAVARGAVRERADAWMPALFMRLQSGALWYVPGFGEQGTLEQWPSLIEFIHQNLDLPDQISCIPILGSGLLDPLYGSSREIARRWADIAGFPLAPSAREELAQVAQYLAVIQGRAYPRTQLVTYLRGELVRRFGDAIPEAIRGGPLDGLTSAAGAQLRAANAAEPHQVLAQLPFPVYITTNPDNLLADALAAAGKQPQVEVCPWDEASAAQPSAFDSRDYRPDVQHPLVYHLFGNFKQPRSIILTEDEYFDYLIGVTGNKARIPGMVRAALSDSLLLFLGFQIDDWNFRVLLRSIMTRSGSARLGDYAHVAVQIDPEESRIADPLRARRYLERYFQNDHINVFWGSVQDFVQQLLPLWTERRKRDLFPAAATPALSLGMSDIERLLKRASARAAA